VRPSFLEPDNSLTESPSLLPEIVVSPDIKQQEELTTLNNNKLTVTFSTLGGSIKRIVMNEYDVSLPLTNFNQMEKQNNLNYRIIERNESFIKYSANFEGNQIIKQYTLLPNEYIIKININSNYNRINNILGFRLDVSSLDKNARQAHDKSLLEYSIATTQKVVRKANAYKLSNKDILNNKEAVSWLGFRDRYFCAIYKPLFKNKGYYTQLNNDKLSFIIETDNNVGNNLDAILFFGPQDLSLLASYPYEFDEL
jgi:YidC/Oxa1 family membrane protein insertase